MFTGDKLRLLRNWKGLAQKQAASLMKISQPGYCKMEKKEEINGEVIEKIKKAFKCTDADIDRFRNLPPLRKMNNDPFQSSV
jgi:transcriptional regulator with XRE-family HTH domain